MRYLPWLALCLTLAIAGSAWCFPITNYDTRMEIQPDSSVNVTETITADFTGDPHHGIYRDIPLTLRDSWGTTSKLRITDVSVTDPQGASVTTQQSRSGGYLHLRMGDADVMVSDARTYVIRYHLQRAVHFYNDHDELYWNAVGTEWVVPINKATCTVTIPKDLPVTDLKTKSFTGTYGGTTTAATESIPDGHTAKYVMTRPLSPREAMTIVFGWPKGLVAPPTTMQEIGWLLTDNAFLFLPVVFLIGLVMLWVRTGADPNTGKSEVVAFDPPDKLTPAELGSLIDERVDMRDISASIIDLAVRGFLTIKVTEERGFLSKTHDYTLELTRPYGEVTSDTQLTAFEIKLVQALFGGAQYCVMSTLKNRFYTHIPKLKESIYGSLVKRGYFTHSPESVRSSYQGAGIFVLIGSFILLWLTQGIAWPLAGASCGIMLIIAARAMPRKTVKGKDAFLAAKGFEEYLSRAERQEIEHQERNNYFEKFLPYAMAFGIADRWARAFEGLQSTPPDWYHGDTGVFRPTIFVHDMNAATSSWGSDMTSAPRSSGGSGGSGFSGGSSGGGGGGGGGGGW